MKRVHILVSVLIVLGVGATVYFLFQNTLFQNTSEIQGIAQREAATENTKSISTETKNKTILETEIWVITTQFGTVFVQNAESNRAAYESSYAKIVSVNVPMPVGVRIFDSKQSSIDPNIFFVTTETSEGNEAAYVLDTQQKTFKELFSSIDHPDFKLASIGSVNSQENAILFNFASCRDCDGGITGGAVYNLSTKAYKNIGLIPLFRWIGDSTFEYKVSPVGCEAYFANPFRGESKETSCENKLEAATWFRGTI